MYNTFQLASRYIKYYLTASNGKGHGIHSPFVFNFVTQVLNDNREFYAYSVIEGLRRQLLSSGNTIVVEDFGAGSALMQHRERKVKDIARWSLKSAKYAQLLFRIVNYYQPEHIIELGTSLGVTTAYLACANSHAKVYTFEGAPAIADLASIHFRQLGLKNIKMVKGNFDETLSPVLEKTGKTDLAFIDGNHRKVPTVQYFHELLPHMHNGSILIFDDIHWSSEMEEAWNMIKSHAAVTCSIDLFFIGIILINNDFKEKQDFVIRF